MVTQDNLKELFSYNPDNGEFTRLVDVNRKAKSGDIAGNYKKSGYLRIKINGKEYLSHRLVFLYMTGSFPINQVDHINGIKDDNRWCNLRDVTQKENNKNKSISKNNKTGVSGVVWRKNRSKWDVSICVNNIALFLGSYTDLFEACCIRKSHENKYGFHSNHGRANH